MFGPRDADLGAAPSCPSGVGFLLHTVLGGSQNWELKVPEMSVLMVVLLFLP